MPAIKMPAKKIGYALAATLLMAAAAHAADIPRPVYKAAPVVAPMYNWSGFYAGGQAGWAWSDSTWATNATNNAVFVTENHSADSWIAGGQLGLRWQAGAWVFGVEGMWSGVDLNTNEISPTLAATGRPNRFRGTDISSIYSVTGQLGYAWDRFLVYAKGGWAGGEIDRTTLNANNGTFSAISQNASGWTVGGGAEWAIGNGWSVAIEYAYYDLDAGAVDAVQSNGNQFTYGGSNSEIHTIVGRLNYTFNWGKTPVMAKY
jgi:outer membrane immunogenic protein